MGEKMLKFAWPWMAILMPMPFIIAKWLMPVNKSQDKPIPVIIFPKLQQLSAAFNQPNFKMQDNLRNWRKLLMAAIWVCIVIALMRPEIVKDVAYAENTGYDLMLAVDLSRSMETVDFRDNGKLISRIDATKKVVANFVTQRLGDRIGLIVFAEQAYLPIPLTLDTNTVVKMLNNLVVGMAGESTSIGDAIGIGVKNLRQRPDASRVLILLTDGIDTSSHIPPLEAAKIATDDHVKIYAIGVGDNLDEVLLKKIATMTGGTYAKVKSVSALEEVYAQINQLEKSDAKQQVLLIKKPLYYIFLLLALLGLGVFYVIDTKQYRYSNVTE